MPAVKAKTTPADKSAYFTRSMAFIGWNEHVYGNAPFFLTVYFHDCPG